jgi:hypothetical protein
MMSETTLTFGDMEEYLAAQIGREVIAEFRCGFEEPSRKAGTLTAVYPGFFVLRDEMSLRDTVCVLDNLCFITFYLSGTLPRSGDNGSAAKTEEGASAAAAVQAAMPRGVAKGALNHAIRKGRKTD